MTTIITPSTDALKQTVIGQNSLLKSLESSGRFPPVSLMVKPLEATGIGSTVQLERFLSYSFSSSVLIPVDSFTFNFVAPDGDPIPDLIKEGDLVTLSANDITLATGIIDAVEVETTADGGESGSIKGRDLMSQLEDQDAIGLDSSPIWANNFTVTNAIKQLLASTRINEIEPRNAPNGSYLLATEPGESKLAALQRLLEPLNSIAWMAPDGALIVGKPNMSQSARGTLILSKAKRESNVVAMKVVRAAATVPNAIVPVWAGQETTVDRVSQEQVLKNAASGPARLFKLGHRLTKSVVVSTPQATDPQGLSSINAITAGGGNLLQSYAKRAMARFNVNEMIVQVIVAGHFDEQGRPYVPDTVFYIEYDRGGVYENMYLFQTDYELTEENGQLTYLSFCKLGSIVADNKAPGA